MLSFCRLGKLRSRQHLCWSQFWLQSWVLPQSPAAFQKKLFLGDHNVHAGICQQSLANLLTTWYPAKELHNPSGELEGLRQAKYISEKSDPSVKLSLVPYMHFPLEPFLFFVHCLTISSYRHPLTCIIQSSALWMPSSQSCRFRFGPKQAHLQGEGMNLHPPPRQQQLPGGQALTLIRHRVHRSGTQTCPPKGRRHHLFFFFLVVVFLFQFLILENLLTSSLNTV